VARRALSPDYSVGAVVRLTGLSEHVLRAWERRYAAIVPQRSAGGTRRYSADDVTRLRLLAAAVAAGHPIRELAALSNDDLAGQAARPESSELSRLDELLSALARLDAAALERQLGLHLSALGVRPFLEGIAIPLLREVGARWERGELRPNEEHAASAALRGVLARAQHAIGGGSASCLVLATPTGEHHELGILMVALSAQEQGVRTLYLGCDLPADEIADAALRVRAQAVGLGLVCLDASAAEREVRALRRRLPRSVELWLGGAGSARFASRPAGTIAVSDLAALETRLVLLRESARRDST
jgi:DNA-binding transcriptional MerR regulator